MGQSKRTKIDVTIAVPAFNGEEHLNDLINAVLGQESILNFELLIIDSGSNDSTLEIIKKYSEVKLHEIPNSEFGHGKTRNLAAKLSKGEFVVFLSQDAIPANNKWLDSIIEPFKLNSKVYCVFGKQTPRAYTDATTKREIITVFNSLGPDHSLMIHSGKSLLDESEKSQKLTFFSDVNSAVKLDYLLNKIPYRDVSYSEDQLLGSDVINAGYLKVYAPLANVIHSNDYPVSKYFSRRIDEYSAMNKYLNLVPEGRPLSLIKLFIIETLKDYVFIINDTDYTVIFKIKNLIESPLRIFEKLRASFMVSRHRNNLDNLKKYSLEKKIKH